MHAQKVQIFSKPLHQSPSQLAQRLWAPFQAIKNSKVLCCERILAWMPIVNYNFQITHNVRQMPTFLALKLSIQQIKPNHASSSLLIILTFRKNNHFMHASKIMLSYRYPTFAKKNSAQTDTNLLFQKVPGNVPKIIFPAS